MLLVLFVGSDSSNGVLLSLDLSLPHLSFTVNDQLFLLFGHGSHLASEHGPLLINSVIGSTEQVLVVLQVLDLVVVSELLHDSVQDLPEVVDTSVNEVLLHDLAFTSRIFGIASSLVELVLMIVLGLVNHLLVDEGVVNILQARKNSDAVVSVVLFRGEAVVIEAEHLQVVLQRLQVVDGF